LGINHTILLQNHQQMC